MSNYHVSVLLHEAVEALQVKKGKTYIDATLGGGGHTLAIVESGGSVLGLDVDEEAIAHVEETFRAMRLERDIQGELRIARGNFRAIDKLAKENGFERVAGVLFDLGVSSHQFDTAERGFSLQAEGPLDMRMDQTLSVTAKDLINGLTREELTELFTKLGEERFAWKIAGNISDARRIKPFETTKELEDIVKKSVPRGAPGIHPATRVFQALRIAVNDELNSLREALPKAVRLLEPGGRLAVISFHSLEDRIVKHAFLDFEKDGLGNIITKKPELPDDEETGKNPRARSAKMRVFEKK